MKMTAEEKLEELIAEAFNVHSGAVPGKTVVDAILQIRALYGIAYQARRALDEAKAALNESGEP